MKFFFFFLSLAFASHISRQDRTVLPIHEPKTKPIKIEDVRKAKAPPIFEVDAPKGAPNVLVILVDDMGFGQPDAFGGPIEMPTLRKLSNEGIRYNNFHNTALCSPTRMALQTGRNHHSVNAGAIMEMATNFPGNLGTRPDSKATLAEILKLNGYNTAAFGKYHETPPWMYGMVGPFYMWPTGSGFERFYGFIGGETNQWAPNVYDNTTRVELPEDPNYHFTTDMTNKAIEWVSSQKALAPNKPFFMYYATGATHAPHHVPKEWIAKYKGKFDLGWDKLREDTLARQKKLGFIPQNTKLATKPPGIRDWNSLSEQEKEIFAHQMEIFAAYGAHTDHEIGRLIHTLEELNVLDNTIVFYIPGDNGASAEGGLVGSFNEFLYFNMVHETIEDLIAHKEELGGPNTFNHYAAGWAIAGNTPFGYAKQVAGDFGGNSNPVVIHWPKGIRNKNELRTQFHHVIDIAPTVLDAAGIPEPKFVNGVKQSPMEGKSMLYSFNDAEAKDRHITQYFEIFGNRGIYHNGWFARTIHSIPWDLSAPKSFKDDKWELFNTREDFSLAVDLSAKYPQKLEQMKKIFVQEAIKYQVFPLDDRRVERFNAQVVGRPDLMRGRTKLTLREGMVAMAEDVFISIKNKSFSINADLETNGLAEGVVICQGGRFGGWTIYLKNGIPNFTYNFVGRDHYNIKSSKSLPKGQSQLRFQFDYDGGGYGKGGRGTLFINGENVGEGRIEHTQVNLFSVVDTADVGMDLMTPVIEDYSKNKFTGKINLVEVEIYPPKKI